MHAAIICLFSELNVFLSEQNFTFCADRQSCKSWMYENVCFSKNNNQTIPSTAFLLPFKNNWFFI